jgi:4-hydroxy-2-oxoheptanedioate aldolase
MAELFLADRLKAAGPVHAVWCVLPGGHQAEVYGRNGLDVIVSDMQHGLIGYNDMLAMVQGAHRAGVAAMVRPPLDDFATVSRALDAGAAGVIMPMINSADDARRLVNAAKYPPLGERSWGPMAAINASGLDAGGYLQSANGLTKAFAMVETGRALDNLCDICAVDGLDGIFVGPYDLSISLSGGKAAGASYEGVQEALPNIIAAAQKAGVVAGIYASTRKEAEAYAGLGFRLISVSSDTSVLAGGVAGVLPQ